MFNLSWNSRRISDFFIIRIAVKTMLRFAILPFGEPQAVESSPVAEEEDEEPHAEEEKESSNRQGGECQLESGVA